MATVLTQKPGFDAEAALSEIKAALATQVQAKRAAEAELARAEGILKGNLAGRIATMETEIRDIDSKIIDAFSSDSDASELITRKGKLTGEIGAIRSTIANRPNLDNLQSAVRTAQQELEFAARPLCEAVGLEVTREAAGILSQLQEVFNSWEQFLHGVHVMTGAGVRDRLPFHLVVEDKNRLYRQSEMVGKLAEKLHLCALTKNYQRTEGAVA